MMRKTNFPILRLAMVALSALALLAAGDNEPDGPRYNAGTTLLFYLGGDNNLGNEISDKVEAIRGGWHPATGDRLLIYGDVNGSSPIFIESTADGGSQPIGERSQEDSAGNRGFARVLSDVMRLYTSE